MKTTGLYVPVVFIGKRYSAKSYGVHPIFHFSIIKFFHTLFSIPGHTHGTSRQSPAPYILPAVPA